MILTSAKAAGRRPAVKPGPATWRWRLWLVILLLLLPLLLAAEFQTHTVKKGDTLYALSKRYGVSVEQIKRLNNLPDNRLSINQLLRIKELAPAPAPVTPATPARPTSETTAPPTDLPDDFYYTVQARDNLYRISVNNQLTMSDLLRWNGFASEAHVIHPGDRLIVKDPSTADPDASPAESDTSPESPEERPAETQAADADTVVVQQVYVVQKKDTLYRIALNHGMTVDELKRLNNLTSNQISIGQKLLIAGTPGAGTLSSPGKRLTEEELLKSDIIRSDLIMPVTGVVTSEFGLRNGVPHKGMDIAAKTGTPIYAVLDGVVVFSGVQGGYGNVVVLEHPDFVMTVYAHNEKNMVQVDDVVKQGDIIAYLGSTGQSTGPHCHFEYRIKGKAVNPRKVLPQK